MSNRRGRHAAGRSPNRLRHPRRKLGGRVRESRPRDRRRRSGTSPWRVRARHLAVAPAHAVVSARRVAVASADALGRCPIVRPEPMGDEAHGLAIAPGAARTPGHVRALRVAVTTAHAMVATRGVAAAFDTGTFERGIDLTVAGTLLVAIAFGAHRPSWGHGCALAAVAIDLCAVVLVRTCGPSFGLSYFGVDLRHHGPALVPALMAAAAAGWTIECARPRRRGPALPLAKTPCS
jgi:hypothetical protein